MKDERTFEAHGHCWQVHTPGDPCPCDSNAQVFVCLIKQELAYTYAAPASTFSWDRYDEDDENKPSQEGTEIIGWRYADQPQEPDEQRLFEEWLDRTEPSGDHESIQRQWKSSSDYADFINTPTEPDELLPPSQGGAGQGGLYSMVMGPNGLEPRLLERYEDAAKRLAGPSELTDEQRARVRQMLNESQSWISQLKEDNLPRWARNELATLRTENASMREERSTYHEWLNKLGTPTHEKTGLPMCLLRRLAVQLGIQPW